MRDKNLIKKSLYWYLRKWLVDGGFVVKITGETLSQESSKIYNAAHDDWVFEDLTNYPVKVYDNGNEVNLSNYSRNFLRGKITFSDSYSIQGTITTDYGYLQVNLRQSYPEDAEFQYINLPLLVIGIAGSPMVSLRLGGDKRLIHDCQIDIFARSDDEKDELQNLIEDKLRDNPNFEEIDFNQGFPLTENGEINSNYTEPIKKYLNVKEVDSRPILVTKPTKKERYRILITFNLFELRYREFS